MRRLHIEPTLDGGVLTLSLSRPDKRKACSAQTGRELAAASRRAAAVDALRMLIISGASPGIGGSADSPLALVRTRSSARRVRRAKGAASSRRSSIAASRRLRRSTTRRRT
jgi:enoyl-CoA hydratase/carnithine racemase